MCPTPYQANDIVSKRRQTDRSKVATYRHIAQKINTALGLQTLKIERNHHINMETTMSDYTRILQQLNAKLQRQREAIFTTEQHIAAIEQLMKAKK